MEHITMSFWSSAVTSYIYIIHAYIHMHIYSNIKIARLELNGFFISVAFHTWLGLQTFFNKITSVTMTTAAAVDISCDLWDKGRRWLWASIYEATPTGPEVWLLRRCWTKRYRTPSYSLGRRRRWSRPERRKPSRNSLLSTVPRHWKEKTPVKGMSVQPVFNRNPYNGN